MTRRPALALSLGLAAGFLAGTIWASARLGRAAVAYRAYAAQLESDLAEQEASLAAAEATIGKLSAELVLERREYAALSVRGDEVITAARELQARNDELHASIDAAFDAGAAFERQHRLGPGARMTSGGWSEN